MYLQGNPWWGSGKWPQVEEKADTGACWWAGPHCVLQPVLLEPLGDHVNDASESSQLVRTGRGLSWELFSPALSIHLVQRERKPPGGQLEVLASRRYGRILVGLNRSCHYICVQSICRNRDRICYTFCVVYRYIFRPSLNEFKLFAISVCLSTIFSLTTTNCMRSPTLGSPQISPLGLQFP